MQTLDGYRHRLASIPCLTVSATLVRMVPFNAFSRNQPVNWLFTSGKPNRYNPAGLECVYFAEDEATAQAEYDRYWSGLAGRKQPVITYYAEVRLGRVLDLNSSVTLEHLGIKESALFTPWRGAKRPTATQLIGQAVSETLELTAIRYPSLAARTVGLTGSNLVIFRDSIRSPDSVRILGPKKRPLQKWP